MRVGGDHADQKALDSRSAVCERANHGRGRREQRKWEGRISGLRFGAGTSSASGKREDGRDVV